MSRPSGIAAVAVLAALAAPVTAAPPLPLLANGTTTRASVSSTEGQLSGGGSTEPAVTGDGRYVAFTSAAEELLPARCRPLRPSLGHGVQTYLRDRVTGVTELISVKPDGCPANGAASPGPNPTVSVSRDGSCVAFTGWQSPVPGFDNQGNMQVYLRDRRRHRTIAVSVGLDGKGHNSDATDPVVSHDCTLVAFTSGGTNVMPDTAHLKVAGISDVYVRNLRTGRTERVGPYVGKPGWQKYLNAMTPDGRYVVFTCDAPSLWPPQGVGPIAPGVPTYYTSGEDEVYVYDRKTRKTEIVSVGATGYAANNYADAFWMLRSNISADGRYVVFASQNTDFGNNAAEDMIGFATQNVYVRDREAKKTIRISVGPGGVPANGDSVQPTISGDGRWIAFTTGASNLGDVDLSPVAGYTPPRGPDVDSHAKTITGYDIDLYDRVTGTHRLISRSTEGIQANSYSYQPYVSGDGRIVVYTSAATNLVDDDTNGIYDVFVYQRPPVS